MATAQDFVSFFCEEGHILDVEPLTFDVHRRLEGDDHPCAKNLGLSRR